MLHVSGLHVRYGLIPAVNSVDLEVRRGEVVCIVGANGAGKSSGQPPGLSNCQPVDRRARERADEPCTPQP